MQSEEILKDNTVPTDDRLNDLPVTEEQSEDAKGGVVPIDQPSMNFTKIEYK